MVLAPVVNSEKLHELLAWETEYATLDFKTSSKLSEKRDQVKIAKDIGAMSVHGGFLVIGVDGRGKPTGKVSPSDADLFVQIGMDLLGHLHVGNRGVGGDHVRDQMRAAESGIVRRLSRWTL
ncbi:hypothetical protein DQ384_30685 [Sphaerisporangium album]|uniref:Schlafen AlbA-2 domain-containing protein n=1 Tax=Sphaerisporangium album TaxID=509200 RepID=A0A367F7P8_9ACTN|nr:hypothetical protein [Sphaerisporangium album]RCG25882.1 hypothetical protein DQ384_30685 [Sphaerisporangium album]